MKEFDIIIIGAGCSGLSLAYRLIDTPYSVCVIENKKSDDRIRKTWSYWDVYNHPFKHLEVHSSKNLIIQNTSQAVLNCSKYNYKSIDSHDFDNFVFSNIEKSKNIEVLFDTNISDITNMADHYHMNLNNQPVKSKYIFDSRPIKTNYEMRQVFKGLFVRFSEPPKNFMPVLMDFIANDEFNFFYCLPIGDNTMLFETTYFTTAQKDKSKLSEDVHDYIRAKYNEHYEVLREEYGEIPLTTNVELNAKNSNNLRIGIPAGSTRASTGYTFINIQKQADEYIKKLSGKKYIEYPKTIRSKVLRKMDNILLMIIRDNPIRSKSILFEMFKNNNSNRLIRFLSDTPSIIDILYIIWNMPKLIFIKYAIRSFTARKV